jgi:hypothetical protein
MPVICGKLCDLDTEALTVLLEAVRRLRPDWRNAETFYEWRSEITGGLSVLLRVIGSNPRELNGRVPTLRDFQVAPRARAIEVAAAVFRPPRAPPEPPPAPVVTRLVSRPPRRRSHHRYPMPPRALSDQGTFEL